ncbi:MAG: CDP-diacylglycerol--glycerol-3-phosphate 3-phosphatidyltransferase [Pseudomonadota bacterium]|nr:CDP-diacylglycerol--glycerol-3-phosphate 3-phosphatidyltransferase [Pseudomonadota bacterium]
MTIPNILTLIRILLMPLFVYVFSTSINQSNYIATCIIIIACMTDFFDGWIARWLNQKSILGMIFDPIADKLMLTVVLILLIKRYPDITIVWLSILLLAREFIVAGIREALAIITKKGSLPVSLFGKIKTTLQMIAIIILVVYYSEMPNIIYQTGFYMLCIATFMSMYSMITYIRLAMSQIDYKNA